MLETIIIINKAILLYFIFSVICYTIILIGSFPSILNYFKREKFSNLMELLGSKKLIPVTIIIPVYNESSGYLVDSIQSALNSSYTNCYVIAVNDASTDNTLDMLIGQFKLQEVPTIIQNKIPASNVKKVYVSTTHLNLMVIDKDHGGAGDSINVGINACFTPYFITFDADSIMDKYAVAELVYEVMIKPHTIAVGGGVYIINACEFQNGVMLHSNMPYNIVPAIIVNEHIRSHLFNRTGWNMFGGTMSYAGTATLFDKKAVTDAGGFDLNNFAQDAEIIMRLHSYHRKNKIPYNISFNPASTVWTDVPNTFEEFAYQRDHWRRGLLRGSLRYWYMFLNPRYKLQGFLGYPLFMLLEMLGPIVEFTAYFTLTLGYLFDIIDVYVALLYIILAWGFSCYITIANMFINLITFNRYHRVGDIFWMFITCILESFGFRQYNTLIGMWGTFHYFFNRLTGKPV